ncbi:MAG: hypothetical protein AB1761_17810, partial [Pseudomonadota bacterium]
QAMGARQQGEIFASAWRQTMVEAIDEIARALAALGKPEPSSPDLKASDDFLDPLFRRFFEKLELPNLMAVPTSRRRRAAHRPRTAAAGCSPGASPRGRIRPPVQQRTDPARGRDCSRVGACGRTGRTRPTGRVACNERNVANGVRRDAARRRQDEGQRDGRPALRWCCAAPPRSASLIGDRPAATGYELQQMCRQSTLQLGVIRPRLRRGGE